MSHPGNDSPYGEPLARPESSPYGSVSPEPVPFTPAPAEPSPYASAPAEPTPYASAPAEPSPYASAPAEPTPYAAVPAEPTPYAAVPAEPTPYAPAPTPVPSAPAPVSPTAMPVPSAPVYDPALMAQPYSAQPYSAQPYSAQPYSAQPYSAPPVSGPYGYGPPMIPVAPAPAPRKKVGTIILSVLTALFVLAAGVLGTLFVLKNQEASKLDSQVAELTTTTEDQDVKINKLERDLENSREAVTGAEEEAAELKKHKAALDGCITAIEGYFKAAGDSNGTLTTKVRKAIDTMSDKCDEADKYRGVKN